MSNVRVRFAPSPTGYLHVGGARTALFNWLYARHTGGTFLLRIEDTDAVRNTPEAVRVIFDGLQWLGLDWDEGPLPGGGARGDRGPYFQSERRAIYDRALRFLLDHDQAYESDGAIRFRMPRKKIIVDDLICGEVCFDCTLEQDFVIQRKDGSPVFHLVNVVDDLEMKISHVIRGEDHLSNTPKHLAIAAALGADAPRYAHIPLILNRSGSKMSKRDIGASLSEYQDGGYLPQAVRNYLCLLGWSLRENREIFSIEEATARFELDQIHRSNARFDADKLLWMNGAYLRSLDVDEILPHAQRWLESAGFPVEKWESAYIKEVVLLIKEKVKTGKELAEWAQPFFREEISFQPDAVKRFLTAAGIQALRELLADLSEASDFTAAALEERFQKLARTHGTSVRTYVHPARVATTGREVGPSLYGTLTILGKDRVLRRIRRAIESFAS
ncbi:glutamyl-tRNA synthetase [Methylacidimicrobium cyclopophantes]|uniref:Glutamate--tRNA ligase n=1 Tax=Methylacidimicrobium cyclopophantes TaxID=1041766 RepID=A0A5E6M6K0_9BACT|nr:glutamate--tRNA ligase [Methylacidimicrobium cyclopophantes]VVM04961.1 glutamyl-tRNA synthetase [Methylacidimicrobium cyclopophantes]